MSLLSSAHRKFVLSVSIDDLVCFIRKYFYAIPVHRAVAILDIAYISLSFVSVLLVLDPLAASTPKFPWLERISGGVPHNTNFN